MSRWNEIGASSWTAGQYAIFRAVLGAYLLVHFLGLLPWGAEVFSSAGMLPDPAASPLHGVIPSPLAVLDTPEAVGGLLGLAAAASLALMLGVYDRSAAVALWFVLACLFARNPLIANPSLPFIGWLLLAHGLMPARPSGPGAPPWRMPRAIFASAWIVMALGYSYSGIMKLGSPSWLDGSALRHVLENPLARDTALRGWLLDLPEPLLQLATWGALGFEIGFALLALSGRLRPLAWGAMLMMNLGLLALVRFADLTLAMLIVHLFTLDPAWIPAALRSREPRDGPVARVYYDGDCGFCQGFVRFVLGELRDPSRLRFAPLGGETFERRIDAHERRRLPDSLVVETAAGTLLSGSSAILYLLGILGGLWRALAWIARPVPRPLRDLAYRAIARVRLSLPAPRAACPVLPPELRGCFEA